MAPRVAVVDDDEAVRTWLRLRLEMDGWTVDDSATGEEFLAKRGEDLPDVIILDQRMPGLTGVEVADRLRADGYDRPIILFSAYVDPQLTADVRRLGLSPVSKVDDRALMRILAVFAESTETPDAG